MKTRKKFLILAFTVALMLSFTACGQTAEASEPPVEAAADSPDPTSTATEPPPPTPEPTEEPTATPEPTPAKDCPKEETLAFLEAYEDPRSQFAAYADNAANRPITSWGEPVSNMQDLYNQFIELTGAPTECAEAYYVLTYEYMTLTMAIYLEVVNGTMLEMPEWNTVYIASIRKDRAAKAAYDELIALLNE